jgi:calcium-dependent protein kinase
MVQVFEYYEDADYYYIVMEYLSGKDILSSIGHFTKFTERQVCEVMRQILQIVNYLHSINIIIG